MDYEKILSRKPYSLKKEEKSKLYGEWLAELTAYHRQHCELYNKFLIMLQIPEEVQSKEEKIPMLPVELFKNMELKSVPCHMVNKTVTSSGTKEQKVSKIYLDADTATNQQKALANIGEDFFGASRLPLLIIDRLDVLKNRELFSARGAGILGFSIFSSRIGYALNQDMKLDLNGIEKFLNGCQENKILIFGFTYIIWEYFYEVLRQSGKKLNLKNAILVHGGGWKRLLEKSVSSGEFKKKIREVTGIENIHNYYGMAEQTGSIYMECSCGNFHASIYSDVIMRRPKDFSPCKIGEKGIIQVLSPLPYSYPGHSILTEDEGILLGEDDCPCGRLGKYFKVTGRIRQAQIRGCSDTYER